MNEHVATWWLAFGLCFLQAAAFVPDPFPSAGCHLALPNWLERGVLGQVGQLQVDDPLLFGHARQYRYHVPTYYSGEQALPLVFDFHGYYDTAKSEAHEDAVMRESEKYNFITIFPRAWADYGKHDKWGSSAWGGPGLDGSYGKYGPVCREDWSGAYPCYKSCEAVGRCGESMNKSLIDCHSGPCVDDDQFVDVMLQHVFDHMCIDRSRVHATGMSDGAVFLYGLIGRSHAGQFGASLASVVLVEGSVPLGFLHAPLSPIAILDIHGTKDHVVPANVSNSWAGTECPVKDVGRHGCTVGDDLFYYTPLAEILTIWGVGNGCSDPVSLFSLDIGPGLDYNYFSTQPRFDGLAGFSCASRSLAAGCVSPVVWCTHDGKHDWPWSPDEKHPKPLVPHHHLLFAKLMWWFMSQHRSSHALRPMMHREVFT
eukprot:TRINITY_DN34010_c0_g1_i1.p1 TRINITY_DN34010_c0_g1~~TRINITY_DN34010_c0_g1_i1.p1  ORF type:complete len:426 (-),score=38.67 TRINITY_DN34010_c0_g1_i1:29-1306(-)